MRFNGRSNGRIPSSGGPQNAGYAHAEPLIDPATRLSAVRRKTPEMVRRYMSASDQTDIDTALSYLESNVELLEYTPAHRILAIWSKDPHARSIAVEALAEYPSILKEVVKVCIYEETRIRAATLLGKKVTYLQDPDLLTVVACFSSEREACINAVVQLRDALKRYEFDQIQKQPYTNALRFLAIKLENEVGYLALCALSDDLNSLSDILVLASVPRNERALELVTKKALITLFSGAEKPEDLLRAFKYIALASRDQNARLAVRIIPLAWTTETVSVDAVLRVLSSIEQYSPDSKVRKSAKEELKKIKEE